MNHYTRHAPPLTKEELLQERKARGLGAYRKRKRKPTAKEGRRPRWMPTMNREERDLFDHLHEHEEVGS